jgi:hypothetical protein
VSLLGGGGAALLGICGPFTDVAADSFCPFVLEIFTLGITTGTTPTTYDPTSTVTRLQMAAFLSRTVDGTLKRGSRRAALDQFWAPQGVQNLGLTTVAAGAFLLATDGADVWVACYEDAAVSRVRASDGKRLETWTGAGAAEGVLSAMGRVLVTGLVTPGRLYRIDPSQAAGAVTTVASTLGGEPQGIAFDGSRVWTANDASSVSIVTPGASVPWTVTTVTTGFTTPRGVLYDGASIWVTDRSAGRLQKLDANGAILQTVTVGAGPHFPVFDGSNIWVPNRSSQSLSVVRASTGAVLATLTGNGLTDPYQGAFDGQRILVSNYSTDTLSLWKAADLTPLGSLSTGAGTGPTGVSSDGVNFWVTLYTPAKLARF